MSDAQILILVATQTGNAERIAIALAARFDDSGIGTEVVDMWDAFPEMLDDFRWLVVCTSTWGEGELPDNAVDLVADLQALQRPLDHLAYGIIGLGDRHYNPHFCAAAGIFENVLDSLGARRIVDTMAFDEGPSPDDFDATEKWAMDFACIIRSGG